MSVNTFFSYIRMFVFLGGTLLGVQLPFFVDQYGKSLESHLIESQNALNTFQGDADKFFNGSLEKLILHYKKNDDQVFNAGGNSIQSIYDRNVLLKQNLFDFQSSAWRAYEQAVFHPVADVKAEVWKNYSYAVKLDPTAIGVGLVAGLLFSMLVELLLRVIFWLPTSLRSLRTAR